MPQYATMGQKTSKLWPVWLNINQQVLHGAPLSLPSTLFIFIVVDADSSSSLFSLSLIPCNRMDIVPAPLHKFRKALKLCKGHFTFSTLRYFNMFFVVNNDPIRLYFNQLYYVRVAGSIADRDWWHACCRPFWNNRLTASYTNPTLLPISTTVWQVWPDRLSGTQEFCPPGNGPIQSRRQKLGDLDLVGTAKLQHHFPIVWLDFVLMKCTDPATTNPKLISQCGFKE